MEATQTSENARLRDMLAVSPYNQLALQPLPHKDRIQIFDTTLRDGEQAPGIALSSDDKVRIAMALDDLGVDIMEAGFAVSSETERETLKKIVDAGTRCTVCSLSRSVKGDVDAVLETGVDYIHTFIATSDLHMKYKLKMTPDQVVEKAVSTIEYARDHGLRVMFSCEDATRTDLDFMKRICVAAQDAGAEAINLPDTVGVIIPQGMAHIVSEMHKVLKVPISMHCHNDMGLAVANTLAGVEAGAEICQVTINGIGERTGNAALEEVAVNLFANYGAETVDLTKLGPTSKMVERITGFPIAYNKAVVGRNAFAHESGIHVHGVMANSLTYEPFKPEMVGVERHKVPRGAHARADGRDQGDRRRRQGDRRRRAGRHSGQRAVEEGDQDPDRGPRGNRGHHRKERDLHSHRDHTHQRGQEGQVRDRCGSRRRRAQRDP